MLLHFEDSTRVFEVLQCGRYCGYTVTTQGMVPTLMMLIT